MTKILYPPLYFRWWDINIQFSGTILAVIKIAVVTDLAFV